MLKVLYYKSIAGIGSMQEMSEQFNDEEISKNCLYILEKEVSFASCDGK